MKMNQSVKSCGEYSSQHQRLWHKQHGSIMINFNGTMTLNGQISTPRHPIDSRVHVKKPLHFPGISKYHAYWHALFRQSVEINTFYESLTAKTGFPHFRTNGPKTILSQENEDMYRRPVYVMNLWLQCFHAGGHTSWKDRFLMLRAFSCFSFYLFYIMLQLLNSLQQ